MGRAEPAFQIAGLSQPSWAGAEGGRARGGWWGCPQLARRDLFGCLSWQVLWNPEGCEQKAPQREHVVLVGVVARWLLLCARWVPHAVQGGLEEGVEVLGGRAGILGVGGEGHQKGAMEMVWAWSGLGVTMCWPKRVGTVPGTSCLAPLCTVP